MLQILGVSKNDSIERIIEEAQKAEAILFLREKEQRQRERIASSAPSQRVFSNRNLTSRYSDRQTPSTNSYSNNNRRQTPRFDNRQNNYSQNRNHEENNHYQPQHMPASFSRNQTAPDRSTVICFACNQHGHYQYDCPSLRYNDQSAQSYQSKNE
jgi:hypothetical protein